MRFAGRGISGLLFDLDGTLVDSGPNICDAASTSFHSLGVPVAPAAVAPHLGAPLSELYAFFVGDGDVAREQRFVRAYIEAHDRHPDADPPPLPGVLEGLAALVHRFSPPMAVATTKPTDRATAQIERAGIHHFFQHVQGTDAGMKAKPAPDVVFSACGGIGVPPQEALMVGDTARDVGAAHAAGSISVLVAYSDEQADSEAAKSAHAVVRSMGELVELLSAIS